jgi:hypothetical protein
MNTTGRCLGDKIIFTFSNYAYQKEEGDLRKVPKKNIQQNID